MKQNTKLQGLDSKLLIEAVIRSALWGITAGACVAFLAAFACWIADASLLWVAILVFVIASAIGGSLFYLLKFRPIYDELYIKNLFYVCCPQSFYVKNFYYTPPKNVKS